MFIILHILEGLVKSVRSEEALGKHAAPYPLNDYIAKGVTSDNS